MLGTCEFSSFLILHTVLTFCVPISLGLVLLRFCDVPLRTFLLDNR